MTEWEIWNAFGVLGRLWAKVKQWLLESYIHC